MAYQNLDSEEVDWREVAFKSQLGYFETLGSRPYDEISKSDLFLLKKKVGYATCGKPSELPNPSNYSTGYSAEDLKHIKSLCEQIINESDYDPIRLAFTILILHQNKDICETSSMAVLRIVNKESNVFIDANCRVYKNWECFMKDNKLPKCEYCFPTNGEYNTKGGLEVNFAISPACGLISRTVDCLDTVATVGSLTGAVVLLAGACITVAPVAVTAAGTSMLGVGAYSVARNVGTLFDRQKHQQTLNLSNREARSAWLSIASSGVGMASVAVIGRAQKAIESGKQLSKMSVFGLHALNASSLVFSGFGFVETFVICVDRYHKGILSRKDVFDLSCELVFFFNAIASTKATTSLINNMSAMAMDPISTNTKLTKTQKRNLRKRAAKRRARGEVLPLPEVNDIEKPTRFPLLAGILLEAITSYCPKLEEVLYTCQSIVHDIVCWKKKEISAIVLMQNLMSKLTRLYNEFRDEVVEAMEMVVKWFRSLSFEKCGFKMDFFSSASEELKTVFCTRVNNVETQLDEIILDANRDMAELQESLGVVNSEDDEPSEGVVDDSTTDEENSLNSETQQVLIMCGEIASASALSLNDLQDCDDILESVKCTLIDEYKDRVENYKKTVEAAKSASYGLFDLNKFNKHFGIEGGDFGQQIFQETLNALQGKYTLYRIKSKYNEIHRERANTMIPVWEGLRQNVFHFYGGHGKGDLSESSLLKFISTLVNKDLNEGNTSIKSEKDVLLIELKDDDEVQAIVYSTVNEDNTASGLIFLAK